ncbi:sulfite exporter TauE/SafE family protein [Phenylobacterium deserti]|uniref:Probable membrane transporter protein n=1 Tax=Phenylobacterium deserti TaxID=1914756 RepID=A0A328AU27_9CAUL|nr:sulfite exporter TauE/SafE family protein [Phenylobacterium deserti]RAK58079.1 sulfite exporter TauE/SafE family protein [Phenylobacterium deserti]
MDTFVLFLVVGFVAQVIDGAMGMAYGVISSSVLMAFGVPPAAASASIHAAEVFTTAATATSHMTHKNVDWRLFLPLALAGVVGAVLGVTVLTGVPGEAVKPFVAAYLAVVGIYILVRAAREIRTKRLHRAWAAPIGVAGGFLDALGGGGWGPVVSSTMVGAGVEPRRAIGTVGASEFLVTCTVSAAFLAALLSGRWEEAGDLRQHGTAVAGLVVGGLLAAPFAGLIVKKVPARPMTLAVGVLILLLAGYQASQIAGVMPGAS